MSLLRTPSVPSRALVSMQAIALCMLCIATLPGHGCATKPPPTVRSDQVGVVGEGVGSTPAAAMSEARIDAIRRALGTFVSARRKVQDNRLVEDEVLSLSDGYISESRILREWVDEQGLYHVRIWAAVVDDATSESMLRDASIPKPEDRDPDAAEATRSSRATDAVEVLMDTLERTNFPVGMFAISSEGCSARPTSDGAIVTVDCIIRPDESRWRAFLTRSRRALSALGSMDGAVRWRSRTVETRSLALSGQAVVIGKIGSSPVTAKMTHASNPTEPGPLDNTVVPTDRASADRTVLFMETEPGVCRAFTLAPAAFQVLAPTITEAAARQPMLNIGLIDDEGKVIDSIRSPIQLNLSTGVLLLAETERGVPSLLRAGRARLADGTGFTPTRPLQLVPAIGMQGVQFRELRLQANFEIVNPDARGTARVVASLSY